MNGSFSADRIRGETGSNKTNSRTNGESPHGGRGWQSTSTGIVTGGHHGNYIDANGDGVCDNWGTGAGGHHGA